jgi:thiamine-monophosphate kinase
MDEKARIQMLAHVLGRRAAGVEVGIGDDAAVLDAEGVEPRLVWTVDQQVEGVHFRRDLVSWRDIGWRSFMAAASDIAAMGARPWCALCAIVLPGDFGDEPFKQIALGQREASNQVGAPVVGGNLARGPSLSLATTFLGTCRRPVLRSGARVHDGVWLAGRVGLAAAGLQALELGTGDRGDLAVAVAAWRRPRALLEEGRSMGAVAHAAVDVSDGLARDAGHLAEASGVGLVFDEDALRGDEALNTAAAGLGQDALDLALYGGEDYALVVASPVAMPGFRRIGEVVEGEGVRLRGRGGERVLETRGFDHFGAAVRTGTPPGV